MNSVLLTSVADSNTTAKAKPTHQAADNSTPGNEALGFAGVLANQAAPQTDSTGASSSRTDAATHEASDASASRSIPAQSQPAQQTHNVKTDSTPATQPSRQSESQLANSQQPPLIGARNSAPRIISETLLHDLAEHNEATLPQRFAQIIAAMEKAGSRHSTAPQNGLIASAGQQAASADHRKRAADPRTHIAARVDRSDTSGTTKPLNNRHTLASNPGDWSGRFEADLRHAVAQNSGNTDALALNNSESLRAQNDLRATSGLHNPVATPDALLNSAPTTGGFSLIPGSFHGNISVTASATISQPLSSPQWGPEMGRQFVSLIRPGENGSHIAELRLDPPELGPLRVTINISDSIVQAMFTSAHANVRNAIEQALPQLQQQLEQEGLSLGQTSVGHDDDLPQAHPDIASTSPSGRQNEAEPSVMAAAPVHPRVSDALVDTFA